ncbi:MAG: hemerythrin domain-containing protein [Deltaproteobacteria bacterium]|nr:hemerythrin domain-containing protein [Deltaproteobacteria bacterium]
MIDAQELAHWRAAPPVELVDHLMEAYHAPLREGLPRLAAMIARARPPGPEGDAILKCFETLSNELDHHIHHEEVALFPVVRAGQKVVEGRGLWGLRAEHAGTAAGLHDLARLTHGYAVPDGATPAWRACLEGLRNLDEATQDHMKLEDEVLLPAVVAAP